MQAAKPGATPCWPALASDAHVVEFYRNEAAFADSLAGWATSALDRGDAVLVVATRLHLGALRRRLHARGIDLGHAAAQGRYAERDAAALLGSFMGDAAPDTARFGAELAPILGAARAAAHGPRGRISIFGEMVALLWSAGNTAGALRLEQLWNALATAQRFSLRCAYPLDGIARGYDPAAPGAPFADICAAHSRVVLPD